MRRQSRCSRACWRRGRRNSGPDDPAITPAIEALAALYRAEGRSADAEKLYLRCLESRRKRTARKSVELIPDLKLLAGLYAAAGRTNDAEKQHLRIVSIRINAKGTR